MNKNFRVYALALISIVVVAFLAGGLPDVGAAEQDDEKKTEIATFAGGCFWCMEPPFDKLEGVLSTTSGYTGGKEKDPTYREVAMGLTGHAESVRIEYEPDKVSYEDLLKVYWRNIDPESNNGQFCDKGKQYRSAIFYHGEEQKKLAEKSKQKLIDSKKFEKVYTEIVEASEFYPAEAYHQNYYKKNPKKYKRYREGCGRDRRLEELWGNVNIF